jgi:hypothetical protein
MKEENYITKRIIWIMGLMLIAGMFISGCAGGYLFDSSSQDNSEMQQEYNEGRQEAEAVDALGECALHPERCEDTQDEPGEQGWTNPRPTKTAVLWTTKIPASTWGPQATQRHLSSQKTAQAQLQNLAPQNAPTGCPNGCKTHISGCDIKGNISINTGEKIYHMPGDEFYDETIIRPEYGERWFCTKKEAEANGWRRTKR